MTSYHRTKYQFHRGASELSAISSCSGSHDPAPSAPALETQDTWGSGCPCALLCTETSVPRTPAHHTASPLHSNLPYCPSKPLSLAMVTFTLPLYFGTSLVAQLVNISPHIAFQKDDTKLYSRQQCVRTSDSLFCTGVTVGTTGLVLICIFLIESVTHPS